MQESDSARVRLEMETRRQMVLPELITQPPLPAFPDSSCTDASWVSEQNSNSSVLLELEHAA